MPPQGTGRSVCWWGDTLGPTASPPAWPGPGHLAPLQDVKQEQRSPTNPPSQQAHSHPQSVLFEFLDDWWLYLHTGSSQGKDLRDSGGLSQSHHNSNTCSRYVRTMAGPLKDTFVLLPWEKAVVALILFQTRRPWWCQAAAEKREDEGDQGAVSRTDPPEASPVRLPGSAAPLGSLLYPLAASSVSGRTPVSRRMYPEKEMDFHLSQHSFIYLFLEKNKRQSCSSRDDQTVKVSRHSAAHSFQSFFQTEGQKKMFHWWINSKKTQNSTKVILMGNRILQNTTALGCTRTRTIFSISRTIWIVEKPVTDCHRWL